MSSTTNTNELSVKGLSKEERQNMRNEMKKNKELEKERLKLEKEADKLKAKEDAKKAKEDAKAQKEADKLKAKEDAKAQKEAAKLKAKEDAKAQKEAAKLKAKEDAKAQKEAVKLKAKEDAKAQKEAAKLKPKEDAKAQKEADKLKPKEDANTEKNADNEEKNAENDAEKSLLDFISQFKNNVSNNCNMDLDSLDHDIKQFVYFYLFTHLISNNSTSILSFKDFDWLLIYQSFNKHFSSFNNILKNYFKPKDNDIVSDLIYHANLNYNDIDIDVKLHIINGQKVLIDSHNVCYHFNHHKPIGKLINNNIVVF